MSGGQMMVVLIVAVVMIAGIMKSRYRAEGFDGRGPRNAADDGETRKMREEIRTLRERIQVLERVITDSNRSTELEREIDKLRDNDRV